MCLWHSEPAEWNLALLYAWAQGVLDPFVFADQITVKYTHHWLVHLLGPHLNKTFFSGLHISGNINVFFSH